MKEEKTYLREQTDDKTLFGPFSGAVGGGRGKGRMIEGSDGECRGCRCQLVIGVVPVNNRELQ